MIRAANKWVQAIGLKKKSEHKRPGHHTTTPPTP